MSADKVKLQINTSGAWKDVVSFDAERGSEVVQALDRLDRALGRGAIRWCLLDSNGVRVWLKFKGDFMSSNQNPLSDSIAAKLLVLKDEARNLSKLAKLYFDALRAEGFTPPEALQIVIGILTAPKAK